jgi:ATP-dependent Clp protease ATP-binding subunit ClpA
MSYGRIKSLVGEELKSYFRPEFLNRLDEIIVFRQLTKKEVKQIADIFLKVCGCGVPTDRAQQSKCRGSRQAG